MARFADVALPVPLDQAFTYAVDGEEPAIGARVLVPFSGQRLTGIVLRLHSEPPQAGFEIKPIQAILDSAALLPPDLMRLAEWIAQYYIAPLGEVLRGMMPLTAEVRRTLLYRITDQGRRTLYDSAERGSSRRSRQTAEDQDCEYAILNALEPGPPATLASLRKHGATKALLDSMVRKRWLTRKIEARERDARRLEKFAVLVEDIRLPKLNANQTAILAELSAVGGRMPLRNLRNLKVPPSTLTTLLKRGLIRLEEQPETFHLTSLQAHITGHPLNEPQTEALASIAAALPTGGIRPHQLPGVTGSGKTAGYIAALRRALDEGKSALLLVPEIGLTPAIAGQMYAAFGPTVALLHSRLSADERTEQWHRIRTGSARIIVGTRSAIFAPAPHLALIIVDEEHDSSYKQEETPRYNARDTAVMRAKLLGIPVVLGSATPSLESWHNATTDRYTLLSMPTRVQNRPMPAVELIDMRAEFQATGADHLFSRRLIEETQATLDRSEQVIILLNRRGYNRSVFCRACGEKIECENCAVAMTYHKPVTGTDLHATPGERLECHYCGFRRTVPRTCPHCSSEHLYFLGAGSQQGEERLQELFPAARIGRMDRDTVRGRADMERLLQRLHSGEINLLVGTEMIAKGHDIHGVTTVGVVGCDHALGMPDFRAAERVFQLITQVSGRAGRGTAPGRVLVQSYHPDHYAVRAAAAHDYQGFVRRELQFRRPFVYPPFGVLANILIQSPEQNEALTWAGALGRFLTTYTPPNSRATPRVHTGSRVMSGEQSGSGAMSGAQSGSGAMSRAHTGGDYADIYSGGGGGFPGVRVLGPAAAPVSRLKRIYRFHLLLKAERRPQLQHAIRALVTHAEAAGIPRRALTIDIDPTSLM